MNLEAEFDACKIRSDAVKYRDMIRHLDEPTMNAVADIIQRPPPTDKYETLKKVLIKRFSDSEEQQMHRLLNEMELGDKKPSQLLREML